MTVRAKKHLGQHFLTDESVAQRIADTLTLNGYKKVLEIGPGMGVLTKYLLEKPIETFVVEIDTESVDYLEKNYQKLHDHIIAKDFLKYNINEVFQQEPFAIIGNFPYNISSQILFKVLDWKEQVDCVVGMFQKEVAERICEKPNTKAYGIISVLTQAYFDCTYLFTVSEHVFNPPPKVKSGVLIMIKKNQEPDCDMSKFTYLVKKSFNQRRKMLRKSLKSDFKTDVLQDDFFMQRPENLSVEDFVYLTKLSNQ